MGDKEAKLLIEIAKIGKRKTSLPLLNSIHPFKHFFTKDGKLVKEELDVLDGPWPRREILARYLLLNAVLDQGPDMEGVRLMLSEVVNNLYKKEIRIFHRPIDFFKEIGVSVDHILKSHGSVKKARSILWARANNSNASKYNLFLDNSKQILNYAIFRWGVPLSVPLLLEKDSLLLTDYLESYPSSEIMSQQLKGHERYGLGKAIGDKAAHLFAKWYTSTFDMVKNKNKSWGGLSFELPLDSNVGRILFRTGWFLEFVSFKQLKDWEVIKKNEGKEGTAYVRVTNLRGIKSKSAYKDKDLFESYATICSDYLKTQKRPRSVEIQRIPNALLLDTEYSIGNLDDGLMYIGTNMCFNLGKPKCEKCPINHLCRGNISDKDLIKNYRT